MVKVLLIISGSCSVSPTLPNKPAQEAALVWTEGRKLQGEPCPSAALHKVGLQ